MGFVLDNGKTALLEMCGTASPSGRSHWPKCCQIPVTRQASSENGILGDTVGRYPTDQGFDEWIGIPRSSDRAFWPDSNSFTPGSHPNAAFTHVMSAKRGRKPKELEVYGRAKRRTIDREITDQAIDFIERKASAKQPFFAYLPYTQTHEPVDPHPDYNGKTGNGSFADVLAQTDAYI